MSKPLYQVPSMADVAQVPLNGFKVVSTFSGAGGSCLGFRMAGFEIVYASEFIPAAGETYRANNPTTFLDVRDIREIQPEEILKQIGLKVGELDVLEGSPPCASFSMAGKRDKYWGKVKTYSDTTQRTDDLFYEYIRLLKGLKPKIFIAENVGGLVRGVAKGYFKNILQHLKDAGYNVEARLLDAQWLGVPQARERLIFFGVRNDLQKSPMFPAPLPYRYSVRDALPWIVSQGANAGFGKGYLRPADVPSGTIGAKPTTGEGRFPPSLVEAESDITGYAIGREWDKLKPGQHCEKYFQLVKPSLDAPCPTITGSGAKVGLATVTHPLERRKLSIAELRRICSFPDDFILTGSYAQQWERMGRAVPPLMMRAVAEKVQEVLNG